MSITQRGRRPGFSPGSKYSDSERDDKGLIDYDYEAKKRKKQIDEARRNSIRTEEKKLFAFNHGKKIEYLVCPVCHHLTPRYVKVNHLGEPVTDAPIGINYRTNSKGQLERRFSGPGVDYRPLQIRYSAGGRIGTFVKQDESLSPGILVTIDPELYRDFKLSIISAAKVFQITSYDF